MVQCGCSLCNVIPVSFVVWLWLDDEGLLLIVALKRSEFMLISLRSDKYGAVGFRGTELFDTVQLAIKMFLSKQCILGKLKKEINLLLN